jgi:hypothetical protein
MKIKYAISVLFTLGAANNNTSKQTNTTRISPEQLKIFMMRKLFLDTYENGIFQFWRSPPPSHSASVYLHEHRIHF